MSKVNGELNKGAGYIREETGEAIGDEELANDGRAQRNKGKAELGEPLKTNKPGSGNA